MIKKKNKILAVKPAVCSPPPCCSQVLVNIAKYKIFDFECNFDNIVPCSPNSVNPHISFAEYPEIFLFKLKQLESEQSGERSADIEA